MEQEHHYLYVGLLDRGYGPEAVEIKVLYPTYMYRLALPLILNVRVDHNKLISETSEVECHLCRSRNTAAQRFGLKPQALDERMFVMGVFGGES